jgi:hypothetical protein
MDSDRNTANHYNERGVYWDVHKKMCVYKLIAIAISFNLFPLAVRLRSMRQTTRYQWGRGEGWGMEMAYI